MSRPIIPIVAEAAGAESVSLYVSEAKIQTRAVSGWFATWRWAIVWLTQILFYGLPWLPWNGRQAVLLDLGARRFYIFDMVLHPQDVVFLVPAFRGNNRTNRPADHFLRGVAEDSLGATIPRLHRAFEVLADDGIVGAFDDGC